MGLLSWGWYNDGQNYSSQLACSIFDDNLYFRSTKNVVPALGNTWKKVWHDGNTALAVGTAQIADNAVTAAKLGPLAVDTGAIQTSAITTPKIADSNVTLAKMATVATGFMLGNDSGSTTNPMWLNATSVRSLINTINKSGDTGIGSLTASQLVSTGTITATTGLYAGTNLYLQGGSGASYLSPNILNLEGGGAPNIWLKKAAASNISAIYQTSTSGQYRNILYIGDATTEDFNLAQYDNAGNFAHWGIKINRLSAGDVTFNRDIMSTTGSLKMVNPFGYMTGAEVNIPQGAGSGKATAVIGHGSCGQVAMDGATLNAGTVVSFTMTNNNIVSSLDCIYVWHKATGSFGSYHISARCTAASTAVITVRNIDTVNKTEGISLGFLIIRAVIS